jgi:hypothetical protein
MVTQYVVLPHIGTPAIGRQEGAAGIYDEGLTGHL